MKASGYKNHHSDLIKGTVENRLHTNLVLQENLDCGETLDWGCIYFDLVCAAHVSRASNEQLLILVPLSLALYLRVVTSFDHSK